MNGHCVLIKKALDVETSNSIVPNKKGPFLGAFFFFISDTIKTF